MGSVPQARNPGRVDVTGGILEPFLAGQEAAASCPGGKGREGSRRSRGVDGNASIESKEVGTVKPGDFYIRVISAKSKVTVAWRTASPSRRRWARRSLVESRWTETRERAPVSSRGGLVRQATWRAWASSGSSTAETEGRSVDLHESRASTTLKGRRRPRSRRELLEMLSPQAPMGGNAKAQAKRTRSVQQA